LLPLQDDQDADMDISSGDESYVNKPPPPPPNPHNLPLPPPPSLPPPPPQQQQPSASRRASTGGSDDAHKVRAMSWDVVRGKTKPNDKPADKDGCVHPLDT
jgi:hypothetical protein